MRGLTVAVVRVAVEIIPNDGDFGSWLMPKEADKHKGGWEVLIVCTANNKEIHNFPTRVKKKKQPPLPKNGLNGN